MTVYDNEDDDLTDFDAIDTWELNLDAPVPDGTFDVVHGEATVAGISDSDIVIFWLSLVLVIGYQDVFMKVPAAVPAR